MSFQVGDQQRQAEKKTFINGVIDLLALYKNCLQPVNRYKWCIVNASGDDDSSNESD